MRDRTGVEFDEQCTTKGSYIDEFHTRITVLGNRADAVHQSTLSLSPASRAREADAPAD